MGNADKLLLQKIARGHQPSFQVLFDTWWEPLFQYAFKVLQNRHDAEEVVQDFFIHFWNKRHELPEIQSLPAYLFTALKNRILNHLSKKKYPVTSLDVLYNNESGISPAAAYERKDTESALRSLVNTLPRKMKQVYELHQFSGLSVSEIAHETGNSEQTVRNQLNTAVKKLSLVWKAELLTLLVFFFFKKNVASG
ncbi:RNA polymerase, sigma-24 subunit, ECF subfamily [Niastella koreensis GR20-10]|uniref:RNA polymerase, sigma-24 subunit, ECF subfamily n=2 Tax=Niastella koreensis TaxID=354356 RepID=G8TM72_NIAKG|nr:sigma-70 family RNA polymerase sigma factor [Niastella koreensis]AEV99845.1 RNA polymerase, sigma-24 subunit, ECF subfamily [Niastella koreensis GR20-10]